MSFTESEYQLAQTKPDKRMIIVIQTAGMKTLR
jgi:hypothetical protein